MHVLAQAELAISALPMWPEDAAIDLFHRQPTMGAIRFSDAEIYVSALASEIESRVLDRGRVEPIAGGGLKIEQAQAWESPAARLIHERALRLVTSMLNTGEVELLDCSAMVIPPGRELPPRTAPDARASVVALLAGGGLYLRHQRLPEVSSTPSMQSAGLMIAHPSTMRPCVLANTGDRAALLMSWDYTLE